MISEARKRTRDMWSEGPHGWTPVWASLAEQAEREERWLRAALCWGAARFPCLATPARQQAYQRQLACYLKAADTFPVRFERTVLEVPQEDGTTTVPVHLFQRARGTSRGLLVLSGGVDTWKMDLHRLSVIFARATGLLVAAVDMPGTGESKLPLRPDSDLVISATIQRLREVHDLPVGYLGLSFAGHWAAKLAILGQVDAAVDIGGPTGAGGERVDVLTLPYGMPGILAHAIGWDRLPEPQEIPALVDGFSLRDQGLLDSPPLAPLLAVNGSMDQYIPRSDTTALYPAPNTTIWLVANATHCAVERFTPVMLGAMGWLVARLQPGSRTHRLTEPVTRLPLTPLLARS
ncbi:alpha/beta hydrolase [Actinomadura sp. 3N407]